MTTSKHTHAERNEVTLVWGSLTLAPMRCGAAQSGGGNRQQNKAVIPWVSTGQLQDADASKCVQWPQVQLLLLSMATSE